MMKRIIDRIFSIGARLPMSIVLLGTCILAYGLLIPWLGFYLDDWYIVLFQKYFGAQQFSHFFELDRPFFGYVYQVFVPIFKDSRLGWQLFALIAHAIAASCFWWLLIKLLPSQRKMADTAALLFAVYPGFQFHWFSVMYSQVFILMAIYLLSFILMFESINAKKGKVFYTVGAIICLIIGIVPQETFIGIEFIRPFILGNLVWNQGISKNKRIKQIILNWIPYLLVLLGFVFYRIYNSRAYSYQVSLLTELTNSPVQTVLRVISEIFWGTIDSIFTTWINLINLLKRDMLSPVSISVIAVILVGIGFSWLILKKKDVNQNQQSRNGWILVISLLAAICAMAPFIAGSFKISLDFPNNRYLIAVAPGACLFLAATLESLIKTKAKQLAIIVVLIGFAIGAQLLTARSYMLSWQAQQDFFWQLSWRIPDIEPNTALITEDLPFSKYYSGPSLTAPLNLIYASESKSHKIPYLLLLTSQQSDVISTYEPNQPIKSTFRTFEFRGNTSNMVVFKKYSDGCLRIISSQDNSIEFTNKNDRGFWQNAIPLSNLDRIVLEQNDSSILSEKYFGQENRNQWCYYFEKADLARQQGKWQQTIQLFEEAKNAGFTPIIDTEWLPLIDAYIHINDLNAAMEITKTIANSSKSSKVGFCQLWENAKKNATILSTANQAQSWLECKEITYE